MGVQAIATSLECASTLEVADQMRRTMSRFATGVTVVTTLDGQGSLHGMTISSFCSLSLEPPLVLVCLGRDARTFEAIQQSGKFAIHILGEEQAEVAKFFARRGGEREGILPWTVNERGHAILNRYHAAVECELHEILNGGDHVIVIGKVVQAHDQGEADAPLIYYRRDLRGISRHPANE